MKVAVTFMRMVLPPQCKDQPLPESWHLDVIKPSLSEYRHLQRHVGAPYCWWMRQATSDADLKAFLKRGDAEIGLLKQGATPRGFYELDLSDRQHINLAYFGLFPDAVGLRVGRAFLTAVLQKAWSYGPGEVLVNTCTADHPRALPLYQEMGFQPVRTVEEVWDVPERLEITIPERFRV